MNSRPTFALAALLTAALVTPAFGDIVLSYQGGGTPVNTSGPFVGAATNANNHPNIRAAGVVAGVPDAINSGAGENVGDVHGQGGILVYNGLSVQFNRANQFSTTRGGALGSIVPTSYISWGWTSSPVLDLTQLTLGYGSLSGGFNNQYGARQLRVDLRVNGGAFQTIFSDNNVNIVSSTVSPGETASGSQPVESQVINLAQFTGVTSAEFRLYGIDTNGQWFGFYNVVNDAFGKSAIRVEGNFATPEPATGALFAGAGILALLAARARRNRAV